MDRREDLQVAVDSYIEGGGQIHHLPPEPNHRWTKQDLKQAQWDQRRSDRNKRRQERRRARRAAERPPRREPPPDAIRIWCDGDCQPNPGGGGWAAIISDGNTVYAITGAAPETTNNRMELTAAIEGLKKTPSLAAVHVLSDSRYVVDGITSWVAGWKRRGWITAKDKTPVVNRDLWEELDRVASERRATFDWIKGHSGHVRNDQADRLADTARAAGRPLRDDEIRWILTDHSPPLPTHPAKVGVYPGLIHRWR